MSPVRRPPGRPRSAAADAAILAAAREVLAEDGWPALTIERVAARAGVAKTTLYRRWSSRADLAVGAVAELLVTVAEVPAGDSAASDVALSVHAVATALHAPAARAAYLAVLAESARDLLLRERVERGLIDPLRRLVTDGLARAVARDEVPAGADADLLFDVLAGAVIHRVLIRGQDADDAFVASLAATALAVARLPATALAVARLPGAPG